MYVATIGHRTAHLTSNTINLADNPLQTDRETALVANSRRMPNVYAQALSKSILKDLYILHHIKKAFSKIVTHLVNVTKKLENKLRKIFG